MASQLQLAGVETHTMDLLTVGGTFILAFVLALNLQRVVLAVIIRQVSKNR